MTTHNITIKPFRGNENTDGISYPEKALDELLNWGEQSGSLRSGIVMLQGWSYDLRPYLKQYIVKGEWDRQIWRETWARNKAQARRLVGDNSKVTVFEFKEMYA